VKLSQIMVMIGTRSAASLPKLRESRDGNQWCWIYAQVRRCYSAAVPRLFKFGGFPLEYELR